MRGEPAELYEAASHLVSSGGKRLRPHMVVESCRLLGGTKSGALAAAAAVEMVHNFTLVHDDIMDNDDVRHGVPTVHRRFGTPVAILAGDVLFSKAYGVLANSRRPPDRTVRLVRRLAGACADVCEGQMLDLRMAGSRSAPTPGEYVEMVGKKTAALFEAACAMGAVCAGGGSGDEARLASFGRNLGIAFQITDDLMGVAGDPGATKKPVGNDIREGKKSLPVLMALGAARGAARRAITRPFGNPGAKKEELEAAVEAVRGLGIEGAVRDTARGYARRAEAALRPYGNGEAKESLEALLGFVVKRGA